MGKKKELISQLRKELDFIRLQITNLNKQNKSLENENCGLKREINDGLHKIITSEKLIIVRKDFIIKQLHEKIDKITSTSN